MPSYISIDLDYFQTEFPTALFEEIAQSGLDVFVVESHEELLKDVNRRTKQFDVLYNVDFHSDLASHSHKEDTFDCDEGTWCNFVKGSLQKTFVWVPPSRSCLSTSTGFCHGDGNVNPFKSKRPQVRDWKEAKIKIGKIPTLQGCVAIGIALSIYWSKWDVLNAFSVWHKNNKQKVKTSRSAVYHLGKLEEIK